VLVDSCLPIHAHRRRWPPRCSMLSGNGGVPLLLCSSAAPRWRRQPPVLLSARRRHRGGDRDGGVPGSSVLDGGGGVPGCCLLSGGGGLPRCSMLGDGRDLPAAPCSRWWLLLFWMLSVTDSWFQILLDRHCVVVGTCQGIRCKWELSQALDKCNRSLELRDGFFTDPPHGTLAMRRRPVDFPFILSQA
jgi:hypothetical protein